jgi:hypothetical protein
MSSAFREKRAEGVEQSLTETRLRQSTDRVERKRVRSDILVRPSFFKPGLIGIDARP